MRTLAIDLGTRRVGLALSDESGRWATPLEVLEVASPVHATELVLPVIRREGVGRVVVGVPLNMDDSPGAPARQTVAWGHALARAVGGIELVFVDERLSSFEADQQLAHRRRAGERLTHARKKRQRDAVAAAGFLQAYLDGRLPPLRFD
mgnify:CR=1 FL=1